MPRSHTKFICQQCGFESAKWMGRCPDCGEWNSLVETVIPVARAATAGRALAPGGRILPVPLPQVEATGRRRLLTGSPELDRVLGGGIVPGSLILLAGDPGIGKCLAGTERVLDPTTGEYLPITSWAETKRSVLALDETTHRLSSHHVSAFHDQGVRPIVEVKTRLGRTLRCTSSHPVLTPDGWRSVGELPPGVRMGTPRALPYFGNEPLPEPAIKLIAYILSDGGANSVVHVTSALPQVEAELAQIADYFGMTLRIYPKANNRAKQYQFVISRADRVSARREVAAALQRVHDRINIRWAAWARNANVEYSALRIWQSGQGVPSREELSRLAAAIGVSIAELAPEAAERAVRMTPAMRLIDEMGLRFVTARNKAVPERIFRVPREQLAVFLRTLFTCDGSVYANKRDLAGISYTTISEQLARDVQHLLLRFGFVTKLRTKSMRVNGEPYTAYELQLLGTGAVKRFLCEIGICGREEAKARIEQMAIATLSSTHFDTVPTGAQFWSHLHEVSGAASFKALSRNTGVIIHSGRPERPLCRTTVVAIADAYPTQYLQTLACSDVYWDEIESITPAGEERVYDLSVSGAVNFVANDLVVHNSTLALQVTGSMAANSGDVLYISAEESAQQVKLRAERLGITSERLLLLPEPDLDAIVETAEHLKPALLVVDSIQTVASSQVASAPGSISQVRESTLRLMRLAKGSHVPVLIIGHVTKEGTVAGPRALEHIVDAVLYLEGERFHSYRLLRGAKNRFGATNEVGVFEMRGEGLQDVENPSAIFLTEQSNSATGSAVIVSMEGTRPLLVEVQALVSTTAFGTPRCRSEERR